MNDNTTLKEKLIYPQAKEAVALLDDALERDRLVGIVCRYMDGADEVNCGAAIVLASDVVSYVEKKFEEVGRVFESAYLEVSQGKTEAISIFCKGCTRQELKKGEGQCK